MDHCRPTKNTNYPFGVIKLIYIVTTSIYLAQYYKSKTKSTVNSVAKMILSWCQIQPYHFL